MTKAVELKLVPLEPTEAMLIACYRPEVKKAERAEMYRAALAAAPDASAAEVATLHDMLERILDVLDRAAAPFATLATVDAAGKNFIKNRPDYLKGFEDGQAVLRPGEASDHADAPPGWKRTPNGWERTGEEEQ